mgnify:FL=1
MAKSSQFLSVFLSFAFFFFFFKFIDFRYSTWTNCVNYLENIHKPESKYCYIREMSTLQPNHSVSSRRVNAQNLKNYAGNPEPVKIFGRVDFAKNYKVGDLLNKAIADPSILDDTDGHEKWEIHVDSPVCLKSSSMGSYSGNDEDDSASPIDYGAEWITLRKCKIPTNMLCSIIEDLIEYLKIDTENEKSHFFFEFLVTSDGNGDITYKIHDYYLAPFLNDKPNIRGVLTLCKLSEEGSQLSEVLYRNDI